MKKVLVLAVALTLVLSASAFAGANPEAKVAVHVLNHASRSCSKNFPSISGCQDIITTNEGINVDFFPVWFDLTEYQGFEYGVMWEGPSCMFTSCSDLTIGDILYPGDGISHAWTSCQPGPVGIPGFGWIYSYGMVMIVPHPESGELVVGDCASIVDPPICIFAAGTNGMLGDDPCAPTANEESTWGSIKSMFK